MKINKKFALVGAAALLAAIILAVILLPNKTVETADDNLDSVMIEKESEMESESESESESEVVAEYAEYPVYQEYVPYDATMAQNDRTEKVFVIEPETEKPKEKTSSEKSISEEPEKKAQIIKNKTEEEKKEEGLIDLSSKQEVIEQLPEPKPANVLPVPNSGNTVEAVETDANSVSESVEEEVAEYFYYFGTTVPGNEGTSQAIMDLAALMGDTTQYSGMYLIKADPSLGNIGDWVTIFAEDGLYECLIQSHGSGINFINCQPTSSGISGWTNNGRAVPDFIFE